VMVRVRVRVLVMVRVLVLVLVMKLVLKLSLAAPAQAPLRTDLAVRLWKGWSHHHPRPRVDRGLLPELFLVDSCSKQQ
jgi:hypothetical protein